MAKLHRLWAIHTTSETRNAGSRNKMVLEIQTHRERFVADFPDLGHDERQRGRTDQYEFDLRDEDIDHTEITQGNIRFTSLMKNAWLPECIWVIAQDEHGGFHLLAHRPDWPSNAWFGTRKKRHPDAEASRPLDQH